MAELKAAAEAEDFETARRLGHNMKGTGTSYGFPEITALGEAVERAAKQGRGEQVRAGTLELARYLEQVQIEYR